MIIELLCVSRCENMAELSGKLLDENIMILNLGLLDGRERQRWLDYIGGIVYVTGSDFKAVNNELFVIILHS